MKPQIHVLCHTTGTSKGLFPCSRVIWRQINDLFEIENTKNRKCYLQYRLAVSNDFHILLCEIYLNVNQTRVSPFCTPSFRLLVICVRRMVYTSNKPSHMATVSCGTVTDITSPRRISPHLTSPHLLTVQYSCSLPTCDHASYFSHHSDGLKLFDGL